MHTCSGTNTHILFFRVIRGERKWSQLGLLKHWSWLNQWNHAFTQHFWLCVCTDRTECGALSWGIQPPLWNCSQWQRGEMKSVDFDSVPHRKGKPGVWMPWGHLQVKKPHCSSTPNHSKQAFHSDGGAVSAPCEMYWPFLPQLPLLPSQLPNRSIQLRMPSTEDGYPPESSQASI